MYLLIKRIFDFISSLIVILILLPFCIPIVIILSLTSEREVFYLQERIGKLNKPFMIFKFATMLKNSSKMKGGYITVKNDPRLTYLGDFLRKSKINELPQLLNIFLGHMSVVGPRPVMKVSFDAYPTHVQNKIYNSKPGLTGIGSIVFRDEENLITKVKNENKDVLAYYKNVIYPYKGELELWYLKNISFLTDLKLIIVTIWVVVFPKSNIVFKLFKNLPLKTY